MIGIQSTLKSALNAKFLSKYKGALKDIMERKAGKCLKNVYTLAEAACMLSISLTLVAQDHKVWTEDIEKVCSRRNKVCSRRNKVNGRFILAETSIGLVRLALKSMLLYIVAKQALWSRWWKVECCL